VHTRRPDDRSHGFSDQWAPGRTTAFTEAVVEAIAAVVTFFVRSGLSGSFGLSDPVSYGRTFGMIPRRVTTTRELPCSVSV
jgi:hypothetical protein